MKTTTSEMKTHRVGINGRLDISEENIIESYTKLNTEKKEFLKINRASILRTLTFN